MPTMIVPLAAMTAALAVAYLVLSLLLHSLDRLADFLDAHPGSTIGHRPGSRVEEEGETADGDATELALLPPLPLPALAGVPLPGGSPRIPGSWPPGAPEPDRNAP